MLVTYNEVREPMRPPKNDRERWWIGACKIVKKGPAIGNSYTVCRLIGSINSRKPCISELVEKSDDIVSFLGLAQSVGQSTPRSS